MVLGRKEPPMRSDRSSGDDGRAKREAEMREMLALRAREGLSIRELSELSGIGIPKLLYWDRKLKGRRPFVEMSVAPTVPAVTAEPFEVLLRSGERVLVPARFDAAALRQLIATLESERC
jgi:hypothetical protein